MEKRIMAICTKCGTMLPIDKIERSFVFANIELLEAVCCNPNCDCKTFKIEEIPVEIVMRHIHDRKALRQYR